MSIVFCASGRFHVASIDVRESKFVHLILLKKSKFKKYAYGLSLKELSLITETLFPS